jgi:hypothetical protein
MATNLRVGETVYVPCSRLAEGAPTGTALYRTSVVEAESTKVRVATVGGETSEWIGASIVHRDVGILMVNIGDFATEHTLLDPLAKSVAQFCRLLVPDDQLRSVRVRSLRELVQFWSKEQSAYSHVIWIGHGGPDGMMFAVDGWVSADILCSKLRIHGAPKKTYISLACKSGYRRFGGIMSEAAICKQFLGPFQSIQGAVASQFCQTFLTHHLLEGSTVGVSFRKARVSVPGSASFRLWNSGKLKAGPRAG